MPDTSKEKPLPGYGCGCWNQAKIVDGKKIPLELKVGDIVVYGKFSGTEIKIDEEDYLIVKPKSDIPAVIE
jgi:chaperonin GroES